MGFSSVQVCMDSSQWLQGTIQEMGMDSSSPSGSTDPMMASSRPSMEKKLRLHHEQGLHCPRCDSTHTKFCYYNNYSLSQPRYFCKSCRRYWTKGGTLRNIPVGGVCRKNKKLSSNSKKFTTSSTTDDNNVSHHHHRQQQQQRSSDVISRSSTGLQLSYPESSMQLSGYPNFMFDNLTSSASSAIDFMEGGSGGEYEAADHSRAMVATGGYGSDAGNTHELTPFGYMDMGMMAYDHKHYDNTMNAVDVKPRLFTLQRQDPTGSHSDLHGSDAGKNGSSMYLKDIGPKWAGLIDDYGSSATDPLV